MENNNYVPFGKNKVTLNGVIRGEKETNTIETLKNICELLDKRQYKNARIAAGAALYCEENNL